MEQVFIKCQKNCNCGKLSTPEVVKICVMKFTLNVQIQQQQCLNKIVRT